MTREEFLQRCATAYDMGLITPAHLQLMERWIDVVMREGHSRLCDYRQVRGEFHHAQWQNVHHFWTQFGGEIARLERNSRAQFGKREGEQCPPLATLANDSEGNALVQFTAILSHPCQICATSKDAWHTRRGLCPHRAQREEGEPS